MMEGNGVAAHIAVVHYQPRHPLTSFFLICFIFIIPEFLLSRRFLF